MLMFIVYCTKLLKSVHIYDYMCLAYLVNSRLELHHLLLLLIYVQLLYIDLLPESINQL